MTTLRTYLKGGNIFENIKTVRNFALFDVVTTDQLNTMLTISYGDRNVFDGFIDVTLLDVANYIVLNLGDKWVDLYEFILSEKDVSAIESLKVTEINSDQLTTVKSSDTLNKVSAYNSDDLLIDGGNAESVNDTRTGSGNKTTTSSKINIETAYKNLNLVQRNNIMNTVLKDVSNYLTTDFY